MVDALQGASIPTIGPGQVLIGPLCRTATVVPAILTHASFAYSPSDVLQQAMDASADATFRFTLSLLQHQAFDPVLSHVKVPTGWPFSTGCFRKVSTGGNT